MKIVAMFLLTASLMAQIPSSTTDAKIVALQKKITATGPTSTSQQQHEMMRQLFDLKAESAREHTYELNKANDAKLLAASKAAADAKAAELKAAAAEKAKAAKPK